MIEWQRHRVFKRRERCAQRARRKRRKIEEVRERKKEKRRKRKLEDPWAPLISGLEPTAGQPVHYTVFY
jgi:hypothetical protein